MKQLKLRITGLNISKMWPIAAFFEKEHAACLQQTICQGAYVERFGTDEIASTYEGQKTIENTWKGLCVTCDLGDYSTYASSTQARLAASYSWQRAEDERTTFGINFGGISFCHFTTPGYSHWG